MDRSFNSLPKFGFAFKYGLTKFNFDSAGLPAGEERLADVFGVRFSLCELGISSAPCHVWACGGYDRMSAHCRSSWLPLCTSGSLV